jgi:hypothetical protein
VREARHEPGPQRVSTVRHHERDFPSLSSGRGDYRIGGHYNHVHLEADQLPGEALKSFRFALRVAKFQGERLLGILTAVDLLRAFSTTLGVRRGVPPARQARRFRRVRGV